MQIKLDEKLTDLFKEVKKYYCVQRNTTLVGLMLGKEITRIRAHGKTCILIPGKDYEILEVEARKHDLDVDQYADQLIREQLEKARY